MSKTKVLFVDDELITLMSFELYFDSQYQVFTANDGVRALTALEDNKDISVLVTDYKMPRMDGIQLIRDAKAKQPELICFLITGYSSTAEIDAAKSEHLLDEILTKPINLSFLEEKISSKL